MQQIMKNHSQSLTASYIVQMYVITMGFIIKSSWQDKQVNFTVSINFINFDPPLFLKNVVSFMLLTRPSVYCGLRNNNTT